jgi:hypothetical protein
MPPIIQIENKIIIPSSFLFWLACTIHAMTGFPYRFAWWVELLMWGTFIFPFVALGLYSVGAFIRLVSGNP